LPENTRIGIGGAGPSGLSAAYALARLGYKNITLEIEGISSLHSRMS